MYMLIKNLDLNLDLSNGIMNHDDSVTIFTMVLIYFIYWSLKKNDCRFAYICNNISHWLRPCSSMYRKQSRFKDSFIPLFDGQLDEIFY